MTRLGRPRPTVLKAVVCGRCWAAHGGVASAAEIGPEPAETVTSFDPAGQGPWLRALRRQPWVQAARADGRRNLLAVARLVALYAQWDTLESRPTWAKLIARSRLSERTVARWLQELRVRGWLAHLERGSTPSTRPMSLAGLEGNRAALYGLRIPLTPQEALAQAGERLVTQLVRMLDDTAAAPPESVSDAPLPAAESRAEQAEPAGAGDRNGSLPVHVSSSCSRDVDGFTRASTPVDNSPKHSHVLGTTTRTALRAGLDQGTAPDLSIMVPVGGYQMLVCADWLRARLPVFARCSRKLVRHLCKPYWRAGWCGRDIVHALDHRPSVFSQPTRVLLCSDQVVSPARFIRSRLAAWSTPDGAIVAGYWAAKVTDAAQAKAAPAQVAARYGRAGAALLRAGERSLSAERIAEHGRAVAAQARARLGGHRRTPPEPVRCSDRDVRRAQLVAEARTHLARHTDTPAVGNRDQATAGRGSRLVAGAAGGSPYERALARARSERRRPAATADHHQRGRRSS